MESVALIGLLFDAVLVCEPNGAVIEHHGTDLSIDNVLAEEAFRPIAALIQEAIAGVPGEAVIELSDFGRKRVRCMPCEPGFLLCFEPISLPFSQSRRNRLSMAEYEFIVANMRQGLWRIDSRGMVETANDYLAVWLETTVESLVGSPASDWLVSSESKGGEARFEAEFLTQSGLRRRALVDRSILTSPAGRSRGLVDIVTDITAVHALRTQLVEEVQRMARLARTDPLTQLSNRFVFEETLNQQLAADRPFAVAVLDADNFKEINDTMGHSAGDLALVDLAARLASAVRDTDVVARLGGDEFAVLLVGAPKPEAERVANRIQERADAGQLKASLGWAHREDAGESIMNVADQAMYEAKRRRKVSI